MKPIYATALALLFLVAPVHADEIDALCARHGDMAATLMGHRQNNIPLSVLMTGASGDGEQNTYIRKVIRLAYDEPAYASAEMRQRAIDTFRNQIEWICYEVFAE